MKLDAWLRDQGLTIQQLADGIGEGHETARRYVNGTRRPEGDRMVAIYTFTGGAVTPNDFHDLPDLTSPRSAESSSGACGQQEIANAR